MTWLISSINCLTEKGDEGWTNMMAKGSVFICGRFIQANIVPLGRFGCEKVTKLIISHLPAYTLLFQLSSMQARIFQPDPASEFFTEERCHILECINAPDMPFSLAQARVEPGVVTALHALRGVDEVYYILSGRGEMEVGEDLSEAVGPGAVVCIPAGVSQRIQNIGSEDLLFLCVCGPRFEVDCYEALE